jgi:hypothetical protein
MVHCFTCTFADKTLIYKRYTSFDNIILYQNLPQGCCAKKEEATPIGDLVPYTLPWKTNSIRSMNSFIIGFLIELSITSQSPLQMK